MSFIILIVVLLLLAPSSLPIMAKVLAILAFAVIMGNGSCIISGVSNFNYWLNDITFRI